MGAIPPGTAFSNNTLFTGWVYSNTAIEVRAQYPYDAGISTQTLDVTILNTNHPPVWRSLAVSNGAPHHCYEYILYAGDSDGDALTYRIVHKPDWLTFTNEGVAGEVVTRVGTGSAAYSGDGGFATNAALKYPTGAAIDRFGNAYVADTLNHRVRRIDRHSGIINTIAGTGAASYAGDGGPSTNAAFNVPKGIAVDSAGNVMIADSENHRVRRVDAETGIISTVAGTGSPGFSGDGGLATNAQLNLPVGVAFDRQGNVLVSDLSNHRIRKIDRTTGRIVTIAGNGSVGYSGDGGAATNASLNNPADLAVDVDGNILVADSANHRVRKITTIDTRIHTIAGTGAAGAGGDGGPATDAQLNSPGGVGVDAHGNIFISDSDNHRVRKINVADGCITTVLGTGSGGYNGDGTGTAVQLNRPSRISVDGAGNVYVADMMNGRLRQLQAKTYRLTATPGDDDDGNWSVRIEADDGQAAVIQLYSLDIDYPGITDLTITGPNAVRSNSDTPYACTAHFTNDRSLDVSAQATWTVVGTSPPGTAFHTNFLTAGSVASNTAITINADYTYGGQTTNRTKNVVIAFNTPPAFTSEPVTSGTVTVEYRYSLSGDDGDGDALTYSLASGPAWLTITNIGEGPVISTVAGDGDLGYDGDGGPATNATFSGLRGVALGPDGDLYLVDQQNYRIRKVDAGTGKITTVAGNGTVGALGDGGPATDAQLGGMVDGISVDRFGNLYIANAADGYHRIRMVDTNGIITTIAGWESGFSGDGGPATDATLHNPGRLALDPFGRVTISDISNRRVRRIGANEFCLLGTPTPDDDGSHSVVLHVNDGGAFSVQSFTLDVRGYPDVFVSSPSLTEDDSGSTGVVFTLTLSEPAWIEGLVDYTTVAGTAKAGSDYTSCAATRVFPEGSVTSTVTVPVIGDLLDEFDETFLLVLSNPDKLRIPAGGGTGTCTIVDNDPMPHVRFPFSSQNVTETIGVAHAGLILDAASGRDIAVSWTVAGSAVYPADHDLTNGALVIHEGAVTGRISVAIADDAMPEGRPAEDPPRRGARGATDSERTA